MSGPLSAQVVSNQAGQVVVGADVRLQCPPSSLFVDAFGGLYGNGSYAVDINLAPCSGLGGSGGPSLCPFSVSTLQFGCQPCSTGTFTVQAGASNGQPNQSNNVSCLPCPAGASCVGGTVAALPGYWGSGSTSNTLTFTLCPQGYCCDGTTSAPCVTVDSCASGRVGPLCGDCPPGSVEAFGSTACRPIADCDVEMPAFWSAAVLCIFAMAWLQLILSDVWFPSPRVPAGLFKLLVYFFQV